MLGYDAKLFRVEVELVLHLQDSCINDASLVLSFPDQGASTAVHRLEESKAIFLGTNFTDLKATFVVQSLL